MEASICKDCMSDDMKAFIVYSLYIRHDRLAC